jgi:ribosomal protein S18 acetylase RimI-like enzyme
VREQAGCLELVELQILSERQNQGLGSLILEQQMQIASASGKPIRLRVLLENRARALYERNGFAITGQTDTHYLMEWKP